MSDINTVGDLISYLQTLEPDMKLMGAKGNSNAPSCWQYYRFKDCHIHIISDTNIFIGDNNSNGSSVLVIRQN